MSSMFYPLWRPACIARVFWVQSRIMQKLDIRTLLAILAMVNIFLSLVMVVYWRTQRVYPGFGLWTACNVAVAFMWVLFFLRGYVPLVVAVVVPTELSIVAAVLRLEGLRRFLGREKFDYRTLLLPSLLLAVLLYFTLADNNAYVRTAVSTISIAIVVWALAWLVITRPDERHRRTYRVIGSLWALYGVMNFTRGIYWAVVAQGAPLLDPNGFNEFYYSASIVFDIAWTIIFLMMNHQRTTRDLAAAQDSAENSRSQLADIIAFLPDTTFAVNEDREVIAWNRAAEELTGVGADYILGKVYDGEVASILGDRKSILLDLALDPSIPIPEHYVSIRREGSKVSAEVDDYQIGGRLASLWATAIPLHDRDGRPRGAIESIRDVTSRREAERALRETEEQLRQSQKMEAVGQLAGGIAHDFNNLLTAIIGYSDLALAEPGVAESPVGKNIEQVQRAADRASSLTKQILAYSRRQALRPQIVDLNDAVTDMLPLLKRTLGEDIEVLTLQHPSLDPVEVDPHQFEQVVMNLALNARDAMPSGGRLTLETGNVELDDAHTRAHGGDQVGHHVMLSVSDTGTGMDSGTAGRVFEPFFTTKDPDKGTGLGLSVVYGIVRQSGGSITVYSEPEKGTTFKIYLPRAAEPAQAAQTIIPTRLPVEGHEVVMVVEDESSIRELIQFTLSAAGYAVLPFGKAEEALAALESGDQAVDILVTDVVLPGAMQGNDLARLALTARPGLPVLYMSGYTRDAIVTAGRLDEGVNFLEKPFTPRALADTIRAVLTA
jgi:PAS domain S-box-containing protein